MKKLLLLLTFFCFCNGFQIPININGCVQLPDSNDHSDILIEFKPECGDSSIPFYTDINGNYSGTIESGEYKVIYSKPGFNAYNPFLNPAIYCNDDSGCVGLYSDNQWDCITLDVYSSPSYVPDDFPTIQFAIDHIESGDEIIVSPGIYYENLYIADNGITISSMFSGTNDELDIGSTIIDGCQNGSVIIFDDDDGNYPSLIGFTIQNGYSAGRGGGINSTHSSPYLEHLNIINNIAGFAGGGIAFYGEDNGVTCNPTTPVIRNSSISNNISDWDLSDGGGGGLWSTCSSPDLENVHIINNISYSDGGGINAINNSHFTLMYSTVKGNEAAGNGNGGGIYLEESQLYSDYTEITNNNSNNGGAVYSHISTVDLMFVNIADNSSIEQGGAIYLFGYTEQPSNLIVLNLIITDNEGENEIWVEQSSGIITFDFSDICTEGISSFINIDPEDFSLPNLCESVAQNINGDSTDPYFNISEYPIFTDSENGDYTLHSNSLCIDAGTTDTDLDGNDDIPGNEYYGLAPDMGAYEYEQEGNIGCMDESACNHDPVAIQECEDCCAYPYNFPNNEVDCEGLCCTSENNSQECINIYGLDVCGECNGGNTDDGTGFITGPNAGCDGVCDSGLVDDVCGVCGGNGPAFDCWDSSFVCMENDCPEYSRTLFLEDGNNLISLPGILENDSSEILLNNLIGSSSFIVKHLIGHGVALFNTGTIDDPEWSGNLNAITPFSGYWIHIYSDYDWDVEFRSPIGVCESYPISGGNNLLSFKWGEGEAATLTALGGEEFATTNFNFIIGQGVGLFNTGNPAQLWSGNLNDLSFGKGYWLNIRGCNEYDDETICEDGTPLQNCVWDETLDTCYHGGIDFRWGFEDCSTPPGETLSKTEPIANIPEALGFTQSTEQAFYLIKEINIGSQQPQEGDILLAYNNDILVGSVDYTGAYTPVPVMGRDISPQTEGFCEGGDVPSLKLFKAETGDIIDLNGNLEGWSSLGVYTVESLQGSTVEIPTEYVLHPAYPNPFNPVTTISYGLPEDNRIELQVYNLRGILINTLTSGLMNAGSHTIEWNAEGYPSGVYFVKLNADEFTQTQKLMLVK